MPLQKPIIIGGAVALLLWLVTRKGRADDVEVETRVVELGDDGGDAALASTVKGGSGVELVEVGFTINDEETGQAVECADAFGGSISCQELDKRILEAQRPGSIGAESNG